METAELVKTERNANRFINIVSIAVPVVVALMLMIPQKFDLGSWTTYLPHINGVINSITSVLLVVGYYFIRQKNVAAHRATMLAAFTLGAFFLVGYVLYHISNPSTHYGGSGGIRYLYFFLLLTHITLSVVVLWFVLRAVYFALTKQFAQHKKMTRWALPIWLYVSTTGVIVYLMIRPYYNH